MAEALGPGSLDEAALDRLFRKARSYNGWLEQDVSDEQIHAIYELLKMGPTSANMQPARIVWCRSPEAKQKLADCAMEGNKAKITTAPAVAIVGYDIDFHDELPWLETGETSSTAASAMAWSI